MLQGRVCFITGASRGIGRGIALKLAEHGATLLIHATDDVRISEVLSSLPKTHNQQHQKIVGDFDRREGILDVANQVKQATNKLDLIIHNAGVLGVRSKIEDYPVEQFEKVMRINTKAPYVLTKELLPLLRNGENSSLIFISSRVGQKGLVPLKTFGAYSVSKFALEGLTWILAEELGEEQPKIRVNSVNPGGTRTEMRATCFPEEDPNTLPTPESITPLFIWLTRKDITIHGEQLNARNWLECNPADDIDWKQLKGAFKL